MPAPTVTAAAANMASSCSAVRVRSHSTAAYPVAIPAASVTVLTTVKSHTRAASTLVKAARHAVDITHSTLRSRPNAAPPSGCISAPPIPKATAAVAAKASSAATGMSGHNSRTAMHPATMASAPPR